MANHQKSSEAEAIRSSARDRKATSFFGDVVPSSTRSRMNTTGVSAKSKGDQNPKTSQAKAPSIRSIHSNSVVQKAKVQMDTANRTAKLKAEHRERQMALDKMKVDAKAMSEQIALYQVGLEDPTTCDDNKKWYATSIEETKKQLAELMTDIATSEVRLKYETQELEDILKIVGAEANLKLAEIENDEEEQIDELEDKTRRKDLEDFVNKSGEEYDIEEDKISSESEADIEDDKSEDKEVQKKARRKQSQPASSVEELANLIATSLKTAPAKDNKSSDKFLSRQIQGRELPQFTGKTEEWPAFINAYESSTSSCKFTDSENLVRLQRCLKGEALKTVQYLLTSPKGVPETIKTLRKRFGRPGMIITNMINQVKETPPVKMERHETWVDFGISVNNLVASIKSLGANTQLANPALVQELVLKLPPPTQREWEAHLGLHDIEFPGLQEFADWFRPYMESAFPFCQAKSQPERTYANKNDKPWSGRRPRFNERAMVSSEKDPDESRKSSQNPSRRNCLICNANDHKPRDCSTFKSKKVDDRWDMIKSKRACFSCLGLGHSFMQCKVKRKCGINNCDKLHSRLLHSEATNNEKNTKEQVKVIEESNQSSTSSSPSSPDIEICKVATQGRKINYMVVPALARNSRGELISIYLAFDGYSSLTATSSDTAKLLGLKGVKESFTVDGFQATTTVQDSYLIDIEVQSKNRKYTYIMKNVRTVPNLSLPSQSLPLSVIQRYKHFKDIEIEPFDEIVPTILVGMDNFELHFHLDIRRGKIGEPAAIRTVFGWAVVGRANESKGVHHSYKITEVMEDPLHQYVKHFFTTEAIGVEQCTSQPRSREDVRAQAILDKTIRRVDDGWETGLLWKEDSVNLPKSKEYAFRRLLSSERKMDKSQEYAREYSEKVQTFIQKGFAKLLSSEEVATENPRTFYLPHFLAYNEKKSNKYRFVFDAAAKVAGRSLNDHLLQGPDKLASLVGILMKFRQRKVAITADIKDFFPRVKVRIEDADAQRFLWRGMDRNRVPDVYRMESLIFGASCSPTCAQEAKERNALEFKEEFPEAYQAIVHKHYVDDYLDCCDTKEEAIKLMQDVSKVHLKGSFQLCNWLSNSRAVLKSIPVDLQAKCLKGFDGKEDLIERVLGLFWRPEADDFTYQLKFLKAKVEIMKAEKIPTKREVLSLVMSIFDPLGLISILTVKAKMILQATWRAQIGWDDEIPASTLDMWRQWLSELANIQTFSVPRCYSHHFSTAAEIQLHVFTDGSEEAFGAAAYFRIKYQDQITTSLVMAKTNVSPLKPLSIPRLELQASLMGARLSRFIQDNIEYPIHRVIYWTDSTTVLSWIRADGRRFQQFVATRIGKIQEKTDTFQWRWVPTALNVADEVTRFARPCDWSKESRWLNGPEFLQEEEELWPKERQFQLNSEDPIYEMKRDQVFVMQVSEPLIDGSRHSSWEKLIRITAYVFRFIKHLKKNPTASQALTVNELEYAKKFLLRRSQEESFAEEITNLKKNCQVGKKSRLIKLSPSLEDNLIVVKGRLENASCLRESTRHPVILDRHHSYCKLLVEHYHKLCGHQGQEKIANELRQSYHVIGLRNAVRSAGSRCQLCKNKTSKPVVPEMGQLPGFRVQDQERPFIKTGLDYFGPLEINVKRSREKRYVALFTCLSTRAVHLEIAGSLSTDSCIMAMRRFFGRRGCPDSIHSDNGTNFIGANNELKKALGEINQERIEGFCTSKRIQWSFNPPSAPHFGGSWERMVRAVKIALGDTLQQKTLHEESLYTLLVEAEHTVNSHPLTHVPVDPLDEEALTPNHFLIGRSSNLQKSGEFCRDELYGKKQWRTIQYLAEYFWHRWMKEYLPTLLRREKWNQQTKPIEIGNIVLEINSNLPRNSWPKGRVIKLYPGRDGIVRVVDIVLSNKHVFRRPVAKLCILDIEDNGQQTFKTATPETLDKMKISASPDIV